MGLNLWCGLYLEILCAQNGILLHSPQGIAVTLEQLCQNRNNMVAILAIHVQKWQRLQFCLDASASGCLELDYIIITIFPS